MIIKEKAFESFTWIDIENANKKELEVIASKYNLNYFLIKDALDIGHLPSLAFSMASATAYHFSALATNQSGDS